jgi:very-short-patch-repair endonuclease
MLEYQCKALHIPTPETEYKFHPKRKWRFDYAWIKDKIAVEVEGGAWIKGRHNRASGFLGDMEKYNEASRLGWMLFRFTPQQIESGNAAIYMKSVFNYLRRDHEGD